MSKRTMEKAAEAKAAHEAALERLQAAQAAYQEHLEKARPVVERQERLKARHAAVEAELKDVEKEYSCAFSDACGERTPNVRKLLNEKSELSAELGTLGDFKNRTFNDLEALKIDAGGLGRSLIRSYQGVLKAFFEFKAWELVDSVADEFATVLAGVSTIPGLAGDGAMPTSEAFKNEMDKRMQFVWDALKNEAMSHKNFGVSYGLTAAGVEPPDFGFFPPSVWLTTAQTILARRELLHASER